MTFLGLFAGLDLCQFFSYRLTHLSSKTSIGGD
jgi:hypothetical protein